MQGRGPHPELRTAAAHVFVADLGRPALAANDRHHLERVLRLRPGEWITVSDGSGGWRSCRFGRELEPTGEVIREVRPNPSLMLAFTPVKGDRAEWVVQKLTEIGVDRIVPIRSARAVVRWSGERAVHHHERLVAVARSAAMQSRRVWLPDIGPVTDLASVSEGLALADPDGEPVSLSEPLVAIGPEGGWDDDEKAGRPLVSAASTVLRSETAAIVVAALLVGLRSGTVRPANHHDG